MIHRLRRTSTVLSCTALLGAALAFAAPAQAGGWTEVSRAHYGIVYACKTPVSSGYGPLWRVTTFMSNYYSDHGHSGGVTVRRNDPYYGQLIHQWNVTLGPGQTSGYGTVYLSRVLPDYLVAGSGELNGQGSGGDVPIGYITYC